MLTNGGPFMDDDDVPYNRRPTFFKLFSTDRNKERLRIPKDWVERHGSVLPFHCKLIMPNEMEWNVRVVKADRGWYFAIGWPEFVRANRLTHHDFLTFILVGPGLFDVQRYDFANRCPRLEDIDPEIAADVGAEISPGGESSNEYQPSETESSDDSATEEDYMIERAIINVQEHPSFVVVLTKYHIQRTLEIPFGFWKQHIRMSAIQGIIYLTTEEKTFDITLAMSNSRLWIDDGWRSFRDENNLREGVTCTFQLVDIDEPQFYVSFER